MAAKVVLALGSMSGTSLDGVDAAMVQTDGARIVAFGRSAYRPYSPPERQIIRAALGRWPGEPGVAEAASVVLGAHAELLAGFPEAELVGFHGQTLAHDPGRRGTHQAGDGAALARLLGRRVVWDFRSRDVALGGQGAPLAPFFHFACARWAGITAPSVFLNLGGVGNLTWVDPARAAPEDPGACMAFDTGPANAPIDDLLMKRLGQARDEGGQLAAAGKPDRALLERFLDDPYFRKPPPKSLDRNAFDGLSDRVGALADADAAATLTSAAALSVAAGCRHLPAPPARLMVTGGGRHNAALMRTLSEALPATKVGPVEEIGLDGDMLEAQAFAYLAVRASVGLPLSAPSTTGVPEPASGGRISPP